MLMTAGAGAGLTRLGAAGVGFGVGIEGAFATTTWGVLGGSGTSILGTFLGGSTFTTGGLGKGFGIGFGFTITTGMGASSRVILKRSCVFLAAAVLRSNRISATITLIVIEEKTDPFPCFPAFRIPK